MNKSITESRKVASSNVAALRKDEKQPVPVAPDKEHVPACKRRVIDDDFTLNKEGTRQDNVGSEECGRTSDDSGNYCP